MLKIRSANPIGVRTVVAIGAQARLIGGVLEYARVVVGNIVGCIPVGITSPAIEPALLAVVVVLRVVNPWAARVRITRATIVLHSVHSSNWTVFG